MPDEDDAATAAAVTLEEDLSLWSVTLLEEFGGLEEAEAADDWDLRPPLPPEKAATVE